MSGSVSRTECLLQIHQPQFLTLIFSYEVHPGVSRRISQHACQATTRGKIVCQVCHSCPSLVAFSSGLTMNEFYRLVDGPRCPLIGYAWAIARSRHAICARAMPRLRVAHRSTQQQQHALLRFPPVKGSSSNTLTGWDAPDISTARLQEEPSMNLFHQHNMTAAQID